MGLLVTLSSSSWPIGAVDHLLHVRGVAEQERQVEHVEVVDHRAERADTDARHRDRADLGLLDRLLLAAELHGGEHLHAQPAVGRLVELLAHVLHRDHGRIADRMDVRGLEHELLLRRALARKARGRGSTQGAEHDGSSLHGSSRSIPCGTLSALWPFGRRFRRTINQPVDAGASACYLSGHHMTITIQSWQDHFPKRYPCGVPTAPCAAQLAHALVERLPPISPAASSRPARGCRPSRR